MSSVIKFGSLAFSMFFISSCANTNVAPYSIPESETVTPTVLEMLDLQTPKATLNVNGQTQVFSKKYFSALGKSCLQYESSKAKHHYCYDDKRWSEFRLDTISVGEF